MSLRLARRPRFKPGDVLMMNRDWTIKLGKGGMVEVIPAGRSHGAVMSIKQLFSLGAVIWEVKRLHDRYKRIT